VLFLATLLTACCGGGKETVVVEKPAGSSTTTGQQLQDLKAAHDQGAITDKEFEEQKEKILKAE
jgi:hypothetical protein